MKPTRKIKNLTLVSLYFTVNSHAGGMAVARPYGSGMDFVRPIFEIKIHEKNC